MAENLENRVTTLAAIDIGSNAARMLIKRVEFTLQGTNMKKLQFLRIPLRLGMDVFSIGKIGEEREEMLIRTMKIFKHLLVLYKVEEYQIYATSAFRDAENGKSILDDIRKKTGLEIQIISGEKEAKIIHDDFSASGNLLYMDVGGGSTELSLVCDGELRDSVSINIGTIRLLKDTVTPKQWQDLIDRVQAITKGVKDIRIVGSGGNINKLIRLAFINDKKRTELPVNQLCALYDQMEGMTVSQLMKVFDLRESRADVIVPAARLFLTVAHLVGADTIIVPNVGLADGMINMMADKRRLADYIIE